MEFTIGEARLIRECEELASLAEASDWLEEPQFGKNPDGLLIWSFVLLTGDRRIPLRLVFPALFPDLPPFVLPADGSVRLSQHQYGEGGELCLQYRPDNWHPDCKSADIVRSAKALLEATPKDDGFSDVESAHPADLPSLLSGCSRRFMLPPDTARLLRLRLAGHATDIRMTLERRVGVSEFLVARIATIGLDSGLSVPIDGAGVGGSVVPGVLFRLPDIRQIPDLQPEELKELLYQYAGGLGGLIARSIPSEDPPPLTAASQLRAWCDEKGMAPPEGREHNYGVQGDDDDEPLFASDGEVSIVPAKLALRVDICAALSKRPGQGNCISSAASMVGSVNRQHDDGVPPIDVRRFAEQ